MTPEEQAEFQRRRRGRNVVLALLLAGFAVLFYLITFAKMLD